MTGAAKAGNLNSALDKALSRAPRLALRRDPRLRRRARLARFLRQAVGQLEHDARLAYVQTIKETQVSAGRPVQQPRVDVLPRADALPQRCERHLPVRLGAGLAPRARSRTSALFPTWNLVEDLQSGVEALRRGWHSCYLPIVGAIGQHSPEDVPNVYKQRGTWAIDTVRLMV